MLPATPTVPTFDRRLHTVLRDCYSADTLAVLLALDMQVRLADVTGPGAFEVVVGEFIEWTRRENRLDEFLELAVKDKPNRADLAALRDEFRAGGVAGGTPGGPLTAGGPPGGPGPGRFSDRFRPRQRLIGYLNAYKHLHDLLHELDGYIGQVRKESEARRTAGTPIPGTTTIAVRGWATDAGWWWRQTELPDAPPPWVGQLDRAAEDFLGPDPALHPKALARLAALPPTNLLGLNSRMADCARRLEVDELLPDLDAIGALFRPPTSPRLTSVANAVDALRRPCRKLAQAIRHDTLCQNVDNELRQAGGVQATGPDDILNWPDVNEWLTMVCTERPTDLKAVAVAEALAAFVAAPGADTFRRLREAFAVLFKAMDDDLRSITGDLQQAANRLIDALEDRT